MTTKVIWKYPLEICDEQKVRMPEGAQILSIQAQRDTLVIWAMVDPDEHVLTVRNFRIYGTGQPFPARPVKDDYGHYIGTVQTESCSLVWHVFEL